MEKYTTPSCCDKLKIFRHLLLANVTSLSKIWYILTSLGLTILLLCHTLRDYGAYKSQAYDPRFGNQWSDIPLNIGVSVLVFSFALLPLQMFSGLLRVGHIVNDDDSLSHQEGIHIRRQLEDLYQHSPWRLIAKRLVYHTRPCVYCLHLLIAAALMLTTPIFRAEQVRNEALSKDELWKSELFSTFCGEASQVFSGSSVVSEDSSYISNSLCASSITKTGPIVSLYSINYLFAAFFFLIYYPNVFWLASPHFANIYSAYCFLGFLQHLLEFYCFSVYHKFYVNQLLSANILSTWTCFTFLILGFLFSLASFLVIFEYGRLHALLSLSRHRQYFLSDKSSKVFVEETIVKTSNRFMSKYWPNAFGILLYVALVVMKAATLCEYFLVWGQIHLLLLLCHIVVTSLFLLVSLILWFVFCVKREWNWRLRIEVNAQPMNDPSHVPLVHNEDGKMEEYPLYCENGTLKPMENPQEVLVSRMDLLHAPSDHQFGGATILGISPSNHSVDLSPVEGSSQHPSSSSPPHSQICSNGEESLFPRPPDNFTSVEMVALGEPDKSNYVSWASILSTQSSVIPSKNMHGVPDMCTPGSYVSPSYTDTIQGNRLLTRQSTYPVPPSTQPLLLKPMKSVAGSFDSPDSHNISLFSSSTMNTRGYMSPQVSYESTPNDFMQRNDTIASPLSEEYFTTQNISMSPRILANFNPPHSQQQLGPMETVKRDEELYRGYSPEGTNEPPFPYYSTSRGGCYVGVANEEEIDNLCSQV